jgi:hypothetical protein
MTIVKTVNGCPWCGSVLQRDEDGQYCLCGYRPRPLITAGMIIPDAHHCKPRTDERVEFARLEPQRAEMVKDRLLKGLSENTMCQKYNMSRRTWLQLRRKWNLIKG